LSYDRGFYDRGILSGGLCPGDLFVCRLSVRTRDLTALDAECQIQFWKTLEGPSMVKEHVIVYEERKECLTPSSASATKTGRGVPSSGHIYNLWPMTTVSARIVAVNGNYEGLPSATITFKTKEGGQYNQYIAGYCPVQYCLILAYTCKTRSRQNGLWCYEDVLSFCGQGCSRL